LVDRRDIPLGELNSVLTTGEWNWPIPRGLTAVEHHPERFNPIPCPATWRGFSYPSRVRRKKSLKSSSTDIITDTEMAPFGAIFFVEEDD
jgi:hypothetical protein